jgi:[protein-PII] uridylyltransferase
MQYDLFHVYTVDRHTLAVIRNIRQYGSAAAVRDFPLAHSLYARLRKPELLLLAGLFHDIAKGRGGDHSELGEVDALTFCRRLGLSVGDAERVAWLVRQHLLMSVTAQKNDIGDPEVVHRFATTVSESERLDLLYLLTVADIRGTSPKLWNSWKDRLLADLHAATRYVLRRGLEHPVHASERRAETRALALALLVRQGIAEARVEALWAAFPEDSFLRYTPEQIAWQSGEILAVGADELPLIALRDAGERGATEVFVYSPDRDGLFATLTAVLDRFHLSVLDARIATSRDGYSLDTFLVLDADGERLTDRERAAELVARLSSELSKSELDLPPARRALSRQQQHFRIPTRTEFSTAAGRTQLALVCSDRPGILAHVAQAFRACALRVHDARIATFGERVEDFFVLSEADGSALRPEVCDALAAQIRHEIDGGPTRRKKA